MFYREATITDFKLAEADFECIPPSMQLELESNGIIRPHHIDKVREVLDVGPMKAIKILRAFVKFSEARRDFNALKTVFTKY